MGIHRTVVVERAVEADDPSAVQELTAAAAVARPFRDASHDAEDDGRVDGHSRLNLASVAAPEVARPRITDAVCPLDSEDFARPKVFRRHCRVSRP